MEHDDIFEQAPTWESSPVPDSEITRIRKSLHRRNWGIILTSLLLVIVLLLGINYVAIPLAEQFYWSPAESTLDQYSTDLGLVLSAYTELFMPGKNISMTWGDTGFAEYELQALLYDTIRNDRTYISGTLKRGTLGFDREFFDGVSLSLFRTARLDDPYPQVALDADLVQVRQLLAQLPEYIEVEAAITFPEDLTMAQLMQLQADHHGSNSNLPLDFIWAAIRTHGAGADRNYRTCGISFSISPIDGGINEHYPEFAISAYEPSGAHLEDHFKSLLKFSSDQLSQGHAVINWVNWNYYDAVLEFVEENGVKSYGCIITGSPKALLNLLDTGTVKDLQLIDGWIDVG